MFTLIYLVLCKFAIRFCQIPQKRHESDKIIFVRAGECMLRAPPDLPTCQHIPLHYQSVLVPLHHSFGLQFDIIFHVHHTHLALLQFLFFYCFPIFNCTVTFGFWSCTICFFFCFFLFNCTVTFRF